MLKGMMSKPRIIARSFAAKPPAKPAKTDSEVVSPTKQSAATATFPRAKDLPKFNPSEFTAGSATLFEFLKNGHKIEDLADMEYKKYPSHIPHNDPKSPEYISSEYIEDSQHTEVNDYNRVIDNLKKDLQLMREYQDGIQKQLAHVMDGKERGNTANVYDEVKDYGHFGGRSLTPADEQFNTYLTMMDNLKMTINNTPYHRKYLKTSNFKAWEKEIEQRPVTHFFNHAKGHKYDVEVPYEQRVPHVADRLGHPEVFPTPLETLLRLEHPLCHPGYLDQPFIQTPNANCDKNLNFKAGEVIYENPYIAEWNRFYIMNFMTGSVFFAVWYPFCAFMKSSTPPPKVREMVSTPWHDLNFYNFDVYQLWPAAYMFAVYMFLTQGLVS